MNLVAFNREINSVFKHGLCKHLEQSSKWKIRLGI